MYLGLKVFVVVAWQVLRNCVVKLRFRITSYVVVKLVKLLSNIVLLFSSFLSQRVNIIEQNVFSTLYTMH